MNRCLNCGCETSPKRSRCPNCGHDSNLVIGPAPWWLRLLAALIIFPLGYVGSCVFVLPIALFAPGLSDLYPIFSVALALLLCWGFDRLLVKREMLRNSETHAEALVPSAEAPNQDIENPGSVDQKENDQ